uniref:Uncharacterized protein n=1 Tax=Arundo donax TaxID=35708 RepID=A0A0A9B794_ARUDO
MTGKACYYFAVVSDHRWLRRLRTVLVWLFERSNALMKYPSHKLDVPM